MTTSTVISDAVPANGSRRRADPQLGYRLDVVASDVADVVRSAGGWLYDRVAAGWDVTVSLAVADDARALHILGVRVLDLESALSAGSPGDAMAASAAAFATDARIRDMVQQALNHSLTEVTLWGDDWPLAIGRALAAVSYPLSAAARAFKRQALIAAGIRCGGHGLAERFLRHPGIRTTA